MTAQSRIVAEALRVLAELCSAGEPISVRVDHGGMTASLDVRVAESPSVTSLTPAEGGKMFSPVEESIMGAVTVDWQTKAQLAEKTGQAPSSFFSAILSNLAEREWLESSRNGYRLPPAK